MVRKWFIFLITFRLAAAAAMAGDTPDPGLDKPGWKLAWHDEFDNPATLDANWEFQKYRKAVLQCTNDGFWFRC